MMVSAVSCLAPSAEKGLPEQSSNTRITVQFEDNISDAVLEEEIEFIKSTYAIKEISRPFEAAQTVDEVKRKFPERTSRIPVGVEPPDISRMFVIEFTQQQKNIDRVCEELTQRPTIKYAQPEILATSDQVSDE